MNAGDVVKNGFKLNENKMTKVTRKRHLAKAVSYRILGTLTTMLTAYAITSDVMSGVKIGVIESALKIGIYYMHERAWLKLEYGLKKSGK